jgi:hypothetical protein
MYGRMRCLVGGAVDQGSPRGAARRVSPASGRVHNAAAAAAVAGPREKGAAICFRPPEVMETVHEVAVYIHRFHNLDLFQQGYGAVSLLVEMLAFGLFSGFFSRGCFLGLSFFSACKVPSGSS